MRADRRQAELWTEERKPWDRLRGESPKAFRAFQVFLDLGLDRSVAGVRRVVYPTAKGRPGRLAAWSKEFHWSGRTAAWDAYRDRAKQADFLDDVAATTRRQVQQARSSGMALTSSAIEMLRRCQQDATVLHGMGIEELCGLAVRTASALPRIQQAERAALVGGNGMLPDRLVKRGDDESGVPEPVVVFEVIVDDG
jgi:hypothetical protein